MSDTASWHEHFTLIVAVQPKLHRVSYNIETIPNAPKHYETNKKRVYCPMGWTRCFGCTTVRHDLVARTFFSNGSSPTQIASSFVQKRNDPKCTQTLRNSPKHESGIQWGGLGAFVAKKSDMTSWHELFSLIAPVQLKLHRVRTVTE